MVTLEGSNPPRRAPASGARLRHAIRPPRLYIVTDRAATGNRPLVEVLARALGGIAGSGLAPGDVAVQLREKDLDGRALVELARPLRDVTAAAGVALYVNDRIDVALAVGADGVHLGGTSLSPADVRVLAPALAIAVSAHRIADVEAGAGQASFAVFGPIRDTPSKRALRTAARPRAARRGGAPAAAPAGDRRDRRRRHRRRGRRGRRRMVSPASAQSWRRPTPRRPSRASP